MLDLRAIPVGESEEDESFSGTRATGLGRLPLRVLLLGMLKHPL